MYKRPIQPLPEGFLDQFEKKLGVKCDSVELDEASCKKSMKEDQLDPVDKKAVKKDFDDRKDQDIDNDGDVDSSDKYLHKRRKAISKAIAKEEVELGESHFKVGDEVVCKASGMEGEVVAVGDEEKEEKYYTVKREDGKTMKYAPSELELEDEEEDDAADRKKSQDEKQVKEAFEVQTSKTIDDSGEDKAISYGRKKGYKEAGVIGDSPVKYMVLFNLRPEDKADLRGANVKSGEKVFRYATRQTVAGDIFPLIKVNLNKGMMYFLTQESSSGETDEIKFETRGVKLKFARMLSGVVEQVELDESTDSKAKIQSQIDKLEKYLKTFDGNTSRVKMKKYAINKKIGELEKKLKESVELDEAKYNATVPVPMAPDEKRIAGNSGVKKLQYNLDRTQTYYRLDKNTFSMPFSGEQDLDKLKKLVSKTTRESVEQVDEATDFRKGDQVKNAKTGEKGTVLHKGNRDEVMVKFGSLTKSLPASQLRLLDEFYDTGSAEEVHMAMRQLEFIAYACDEISDYLEMRGDMDEWFQNKLAAVHDRMMGLHAYIEGDKRMQGGYDAYGESHIPYYGEEELDEKMQDTWTVELPNLKKKVPVRARNSTEALKKAAKRAGVDWRTVKVGKVQKEEVELDEGVGEYTVKILKKTSEFKIYDIMKDGEKVGVLKHHPDSGSITGKLHGKDLPDLYGYKSAGSGPLGNLHAFLKSKTGQKFNEEVEQIDEKAVSQAQQKLMGMALAYKRGEMDDASDEVKELADSMSEKDLEDFAKTKHKGLPVTKEKYLAAAYKKMKERTGY